MAIHRWKRLVPSTLLVALVTTVFTGALLPALGASDDDEQSAKLGDLPKVIRQALRGVEVEEIEKETTDGKTVYEVTIELDDDAELELVLDHDGRLLGLEVEDDEQGDDDDDGKDDADEKEGRKEKD